MIGLVFLHGWAYGPETWDDWVRAVGDTPVVVLNAGYFGLRRMNLPAELPSNPDGWVGVGHSLGFARLLEMDVPWRGLFGLSGFLRFCQSTDKPTGTPAKVVDAMIHRLDDRPADVLSRFHRRCGNNEPCQGMPMAGGLARLRADLEHLRDLNLTPSKAPVPTLLVHAQDDQIVPLDLAREAQSLLPGSRLETLDSGGHALPMTRTKDCLRLLQGFVNGLG